MATERIEWAALVDRAENHGLVPTASRRLTEIEELLPQSALQRLRHISQQNAQQTLWLTQMLFSLTDRLRKNGVTALPYKGPILAHLLYGNVTQREYSDLDILIRPSDVPRAKAALQKLGYTPSIQLTVAQERAHIATGYEYTFHGQGCQNLVELQWRILPSFYSIDFDTAKFFARAQQVRIGDRTVETMAFEDLVLVLCAHAAKHAWSKLSWIVDIGELVRSREIDWVNVVQSASVLGISRIVGITFCMAQQLLRTAVPARVQRVIDEDSEVENISARLCRDMCDERELPVDSMAYFRFLAGIRERRMDRMRLGLRLATTPSVGEWSAIHLPGPMFPLYRVVRAGRLARRFLRRNPSRTIALSA